jgi:hypothetical protein
MIQKPFDQIDIADLKQLLENKVPEGKTIEYKAELNISRDAEKKEFLYDLSSFANAIGGDIIFGIAEGAEKGLPGSINGIDVDMDEAILKIESMVRDNISPRILNIAYKSFVLDTGKKVLLIRIPKSLNAPHQVKYQGIERFYSRANNGKYILDVTELRSSFLQTSLITDKIRNFVTDRIAKITADDTPVKLVGNPKILLHIIPLQSISSDRLNSASIEMGRKMLFPLASGGYNERFNLEGVLNFSRPRGAKEDHAYVQIYRSGILETVNADMLAEFDGKKLISVEKGSSVEESIIEFITKGLNFLKDNNVNPPLYLFLNLINVKGYGIGSSRLRQSVFGERGIDRDILQLSEIEVQSYPQNIPSLLRDWFEMIWNACGYEKCLSYNSAGEFTAF